MDISPWNAFRAYRRGTLGADHALIEATLPIVLCLAQKEQISGIYQVIGERAHHFKKYDLLIDWLRPIIDNTPLEDEGLAAVEPIKLAVAGLESARSQPEPLGSIKDRYARFTINGFIPAFVCSGVLFGCLEQCWYRSCHPLLMTDLGLLTYLFAGATLITCLLGGLTRPLWDLFRPEWYGWGALSLSSVYTLAGLSYFLATLGGNTPHHDGVERCLELLVCLLLSIFGSALFLAPHLALIQSRPWISSAHPRWFGRLTKVGLWSAFLFVLIWSGNFIYRRSLGFELKRASLGVAPRHGQPTPYFSDDMQKRYFHDSSTLFRPLRESQQLRILRSTRPGASIEWVGLKHLLGSIRSELTHGGHLSPRVRGELIEVLESRGHHRPMAHLKQRLLQEAAYQDRLPLSERDPADVKRLVEGWHFLKDNPRFESLQHSVSKEQTQLLAQQFPFWSNQLTENFWYWQTEQLLLELLVADDLSYHRGEKVRSLRTLRPETQALLKRGETVFSFHLDYALD